MVENIFYSLKYCKGQEYLMRYFIESFLNDNFLLELVNEYGSLNIINISKIYDEKIIGNEKYTVKFGRRPYTKHGDIFISRSSINTDKKGFTTMLLHEILYTYKILKDINIFKYDKTNNQFIFAPCLFDNDYFISEFIRIFGKRMKKIVPRKNVIEILIDIGIQNDEHRVQKVFVSQEVSSELTKGSDKLVGNPYVDKAFFKIIYSIVTNMPAFAISEVNNISIDKLFPDIINSTLKIKF